MVNQYSDEKSQNVYCVIDMGKSMKMPFNGMTLLDYSINASLIIADIAVYKKDNAGLLTFAKEIDAFLPASKKQGQIRKVMDLLYKQKTRFNEANFELLHNYSKRKIKQRSLIMLFTNFESYSTIERNIPFLQGIAKKHLLVTVFFKNTGLNSILNKDSDKVKDIYDKTIAENMAYEKRMIVKELNQLGIMTVYTSPENLTIDSLNKYLEIKSRRIL